MRVRQGQSTNDVDNEFTAAVEAMTFASRWIPFGGADSYEIYVTFGVTPAQFGQRLRRAADSAAAGVHLNLSSDERDRLRAEARRLCAMSWNVGSDNDDDSA